MNSPLALFWKNTAVWILKFRFILVGIIAILTLFFGFKAYTDLRLSYELPKILPKNDTHFIEYDKFKKIFGEDGNVMVIA
ncbi:MAG: hypothetical protein ACRCVT_09700, partial [Leadbetterella sp.]